MLKMTTTLFCAIIIGSGIAISRGKPFEVRENTAAAIIFSSFHFEGQEVYFQEIDFSTDGGNKAHVKVRHNGQNLVPFTIRVHPVTLNQYFTVFGGVGCTTLGINVNPAEGMVSVLLCQVVYHNYTKTYIFKVMYLINPDVSGVFNKLQQN